MSEPGPSTSQAEASTDIDVEAATLLSKGRSFLLKDDAPNAVQNLQEACELLGSKYGELAKECGECYYYYGWALLELARLENDVLGNALDGVPDEEDTDTTSASATADKPDTVEDPEQVDKKERRSIFRKVQRALKAKKQGAGQAGASSQEDTSSQDEATSQDEEEATSKDEEATSKDEEATSKDEEASGQEGEAGDQKEPAADQENAAAVKGEAEKADQAVADVAEKKEPEKPSAADKVEEVDKDATEQPMEASDDGLKIPAKVAPAEEEEAKGDGKGDNEGDGDAGDDDEDDEDAKGAEAASAEEQDEDISNFQLSWEMLELARIIFSQQEGDEFKLKVSQVYLKLGELGLERGNYAQSVEDFTLCLKTQTEQLSKDSRLLAETHYNLALAYSFDQKFDKAIENFDQSTTMIKNRITMLKNKPAEGRTDEELAQEQKEIKELETLIPEIKLKIDDAKAEKNTLESAVGQALRSASAEFGLGTSSSSAPSTSGFQTGCSSSGAAAKPVSMIAVRKPADAKPDDISHLMHRKRNLEVEPEQEAAGKKARQEGGGDASSASNAASAASTENAPDADKAANGDCSATADVNGSNGLEQTTMNGDAKASPEQLKVKKIEQTSNGDAPTAPMET